MFFWGLGVELVNAYKMYRINNLNMGISEKKLLSHFEFQKEIAINYITSGVKKPPPAISTAQRKRNRWLHEQVFLKSMPVLARVEVRDCMSRRKED